MNKPVKEKLPTGRTLNESAYRYVQQVDDMTAIFCEDGFYQIFVARPDGVSGWALIYDGMQWEFCHTLTEKECKAYGINHV